MERGPGRVSELGQSHRGPGHERLGQCRPRLLRERQGSRRPEPHRGRGIWHELERRWRPWEIIGGAGVRAESIAGHGVFATGVVAVKGESTTAGEPAIYGHNDAADAAGVVGEASTGTGVAGITNAGTAGQFEALQPSGTALKTVGRAQFSRSGKVTFNAGNVSKTVTNHAIEADTIVVATIQGNVSGTWVRGVSVSAAADTFTIRLNKAAPSQLTVGFFIIN